MRFNFLLSMLAAATAAPAPGNLETRQESAPGYIVRLPAGLGVSTVLGLVGLPESAVSYRYELINGFAVTSAAAPFLNALNGILGVSVQPDVEMFASAVVNQGNAPWGLQRISSGTPIAAARAAQVSEAAFTYTYDDTAAGRGIEVYVIDTGINCAHQQFGGRAKCPRDASFGLLNRLLGNRDGNGHGTHCAGTIGGSTFGVSKQVSLNAVKVLSDAGSGMTSDIIAGIEYVVRQASAHGRPTVASMSLGGGASPSLDDAVAAAIRRGVHFSIAAGNSNEDACTTSPARVPGAITVGASNITDSRADFSNFGRCLDIFAPGVDVLSAWYRSRTDTNVISGTSMAAPHVAGVMAYELSLAGRMSPAALRDRVVGKSAKNVLRNVGAGSPNALLQL